MTRTDHTRSLFLVALVVLAAVVGTVAVTGTVGAQDAGNETGINASDTNVEEPDVEDPNADDESFYSPPEEDPLNARFRDGAANTVESVAEGILNLNLVYGLFDGSYDVEITASGLSEEQVEDITFDEAEFDTNNLSRTDIVGLNFTGVPAGEYVFTVSVVGGDATETIPLEVTDEGGAADTANESATNETTTGEPTNETTDTATEMGNETEMGASQMGNATANATAGNATITAVPSTPNATANQTVTVTVGPEAAGNLTGIAINYTEGNVSTIGAALVSVNVTSQNGTTETLYTAANVSSIGYGFSGEMVNISFGGTHVRPISAGEEVTIVYSGVKNAPQPGNYNVTVDINPTSEGGVSNATLVIGQNATAGNATTGNETEMGTAQLDNATANATAGNATITAMPSAANATANHTVTVTVGPEAAGNLTGIAVNYTEGNVSTIGAALVSVNVTSQNGTTETLYTAANVSSIGYGFSGELVNISFGGTHIRPISAGEEVTIVYSGVKNAPQPGNYNVTVDINPASEGGVSTAQLTITEAETNATTPSGTPTTTTGAGTATTTGGQTTTGAGTANTAAETVAGTDGGSGGGGGQQGTEAGGPGFGIAVAVVALLAAALLAVRRD